MSWRSKVRTSLIYLVSMIGGFTLAWLIVAFVIFPTGVVPRDVKVPNVTGLMYDEAEQRLAQRDRVVELREQVARLALQDRRLVGLVDPFAHAVVISHTASTSWPKFSISAC